MMDTYSALALVAAACTAVMGAVVLFRRLRIQRAYDEMRRLYGEDWQ